MKSTDEKGVALILVMIMLAVLSIIAASLMSVSGAETSASMNYRLMTLARYGGESAVHKAANYLMSMDDATTLALWSSVGSGSTVTPVTYGGEPVVLSSDAGTVSNYPPGAVVSAFDAAARGTLTGGTSPVSYSAVATLVAMRQLQVGGAPKVAQTWKITGTGSLSGSRPAQVEVSSILERQVTPTFSYAAFATYSGCGALDWQGNSKTDSYNSALGHVPDVPAFGGNVGTNGNLTLTGNAEINGTLSTIRTGVGDCAGGNALTGSLSKVDGMVELPQLVVSPTPAPPATLSATLVALSPSDTRVLAPGNYGDLSIKGTLTLSTGTYSINSISMTSQGQIEIGVRHTVTGSAAANTLTKSSHGLANTTRVMIISSVTLPVPLTANTVYYVVSTATNTFQLATASGGVAIDLTSNGSGTIQVIEVDTAGPVIMNVAGYATAGVYQAVPSRTDPITLYGGGYMNVSTFDPSMFQITYAGSQTISLQGTAGITGLIYAPNAIVTNGGTVDWYGAIIGGKVKDFGTATIHYDRQLQTKAMMPGAWMLDSFIWKKF